MVTIPQTELGFGCGGWSAWRGTIFVAFGDQLHHSFWMSKQRHPLFTVCTGVPCPRDHRGAMASINVPRTVSKMWWTFNDLPSYAGSSWHLLKEGIPSTSKTITQIHRSICPSFVHTLSMYISLYMIFNAKVQTTQCSDFAQSHSSHSIYSFLDILVLITAYLLSFLGHPTKFGKELTEGQVVYTTDSWTLEGLARFFLFSGKRQEEEIREE